MRVWNAFRIACDSSRMFNGAIATAERFNLMRARRKAKANIDVIGVGSSVYSSVSDLIGADAVAMNRELIADLTATTWRLRMNGIRVESKDEIVVRLQQSPDKGESRIYAVSVAFFPGAGLRNYYAAQWKRRARKRRPCRRGSACAYLLAAVVSRSAGRFCSLTPRA
jgi:hypothetical protein